MATELRKAVWIGVLALTLIGPAAWPAGAQEAETARKVTKRVNPVCPAFAAHLSGTVRILLVVSAEGRVKSLRTLGGNATLASVAEAAARQWKFEPAKKETNESVAFKFDGQ